MVRALLAGTKSQTRRAIKPQPETQQDGEPYWHVGGYRVWGYRPASAVPLRAGGNPLPCPYGQPGDRLWVREAYRFLGVHDHVPPRELSSGPVWYEAQDEVPFHPSNFGKLRPGMFMPRWASRILLEVTEVRVERLQDISEADAIAEGLGRTAAGHWLPGPCDHPEWAYHQLWDQINGAGAWDLNPFVWCVSFRRIDAS